MATKKSVRVSNEQIVALAYDNPGSDLELDHALGYAFLSVAGVEYVAAISGKVAPS